MKKLTHLITPILFVFVLASCNQDETLKPNSQPISYRDHCGSALSLSHPAEVNVGEQFNIVGTYSCGRVSLERGYVLAPDNVTRIYTGLSCEDEGDLLWELVVNNACYTTDINQAVTLNETGTHVFRTRHLSNDGNCDGLGGSNQTGNCSFTGTNFCCFEILAVETCVIDSADYFTYSQGFYLQSPNGETFLSDPAFGPVTVGCEDGTTTTYTIAEIRAFDPGESSAPGILVKQIITMTLNVTASEAGILGANGDLGCLVVVADEDPLTTLDDLFAGLTVSEIIAAANDYVGGCDTTTYSAGDLTAILAAIVDNFHVGETPGTLLTCCE